MMDLFPRPKSLSVHFNKDLSVSLVEPFFFKFLLSLPFPPTFPLRLFDYSNVRFPFKFLGQIRFVRQSSVIVGSPFPSEESCSGLVSA